MVYYNIDEYEFRSPTIEDFKYPFMFIKNERDDNDYYDIQNIYKTIPINGYSELSKKNIDIDNLDDFYHKLKDDDIIYARPGESDGDDWLLVAKYNEIYIFYKAWCDSTGFDCRGCMSLYASYDLHFLLDNALTEKERDELGIK